MRIALSGAARFNIIIWADLEALTAALQHGNQMLFVCLTDCRRFISCARFCYFLWISGLQSRRFPPVPFSISSLWVLFTNQFERDELCGKSWQCSLSLFFSFFFGLSTRHFVHSAAAVEMFSYHVLETNMQWGNACRSFVLIETVCLFLSLKANKSMVICKCLSS